MGKLEKNFPVFFARALLIILVTSSLRRKNSGVSEPHTNARIFIIPRRRITSIYLATKMYQA